MSYRRPVLRPTRCSTRKEPSSTPCSGEPRNTRTSGLPILTRAGGGTDRFTVLVIAQHLLPITLPCASRCSRVIGHIYGLRAWGRRELPSVRFIGLAAAGQYCCDGGNPGRCCVRVLEE